MNKTEIQTCPQAHTCRLLQEVQRENARLRALLRAAGIDVSHTDETPRDEGSTQTSCDRQDQQGECPSLQPQVHSAAAAAAPSCEPEKVHAPEQPHARPAAAPEPAKPGQTPVLPPLEKVHLFASLFAGRRDMFALRWETSSRSGYALACSNKWRPGICGLPKSRCAECTARSCQVLNDTVLYNHLAGKHVVGIYPIHQDNTCRFVCVDFGGTEWKDNAQAYMQTAAELGVPVLAEISRSGAAAHVWTFFSGPVPAELARNFATSLLSKTSVDRRVMDLSVYDGIFPAQDTAAKPGLGRCIALPLQKKSRADGATVFVDPATFIPYTDQWFVLQHAARISPDRVLDITGRLCGGASALDLDFDDTDPNEPWRRRSPSTISLSGNVPECVHATLAGELFLRREDLTGELILRLRRLAAFINPEFTKAEAMRLSVWNIPRVICCARMLPRFLALPRACLPSVRELLNACGIRLELKDSRVDGTAISADFLGTLRVPQQKALDALLPHEMGILSAPTAFGKTVLAAALIAARKVSTLVLVHRADLLRQWQERLQTFLQMGEGHHVGFFGGGKKKDAGDVDIAIMQSLLRLEDPGEWMSRYGQIIVDECHHVSALSFEKLLREARARWVTGLTATPIRRDGQQPVIFMQCGPIRHVAKAERTAFRSMVVRLRHIRLSGVFEGMSIQDAFRAIMDDTARNARIVQDTRDAYAAGRSVIVLTERLEHLEMLRSAFETCGIDPVLLHGRQGAREREASRARLEEMDPTAPRVVLATGKLIGEGFDHPPLDTLVLAMPISWKGNLQQYAGRIHRRSEGKKDIVVFDYVEDGVRMLERMWSRRMAGYVSMGYTLAHLPQQAPVVPELGFSRQ